MHSGFIWLTTGTSGWPCEYHNEHMGCITLGEIVVYLMNYQVVNTHLLKYAHQKILKIVILGLALIYYGHKVLCIAFCVPNLISILCL